MSAFAPMEPDFEAVTRARLANSVVARHFGFDVEEVGAGAIVLRLDGRPEYGHRPGYFQGAIIAAMADYAGSFAAYTLTGRDWNLLTLDLALKYLAPAKGEALIGRGRMLSAGKTLSTTQTDIFVRTQCEEHLCATALVSVRHTPPRAS